MKQKQFKRQHIVLFRQWSNKRYGAFNSLKKVIKICTLAVAYSIVAKPVHVKAQGADSMSTRITEIDDVTVQSTLIEMKNAETGRSIEIINGAQIQSLPVTTLDELLRYIPGIDAQQRGAFGTQTDFSLRGSNFNQVLVLIDGQKINDPLTAHFNSNIPVSPSEIEHIEIIRGPASLEYGPDATGGVINIITKTFSKNQQIKGLNANAKMHYGQYNLINSDGGLYYETEKYKISCGALLNKSDGNPLESGLKNHFDIRDVSVSGQIKFNRNWSSSYRYANDYRNFNAQWFYTTYASDKATEKIKRQSYQFQLNRSSEKSSTQLLMSYINTNDYYLFTHGIAPNENLSGSFNSQVNHKINVSSILKAVLGSSLEQRIVESSDRGNHAILHYAFYTTVSVKPLERLTINGGLRCDNDQKYGFYLLPQLGVSYKLTNLGILRFAFGRSIRTPDFTESYSNNFRKDTLKTGVAIGNPGLLPEKTWNSELGYDLNLFKHVLFSITGFYRNSAGIIDYVYTPDTAIHINNIKQQTGSSFWFAQNNSKTNTYGVESRLSVSRKVLSQLNIKVVGGYTFIYLDASFAKPSRYAILTPKHLVNGELSFEYNFISWNINGIYKVRKSQFNAVLQRYLKKSYAVWNTNIDIAVYRKNIFLSLAAYNIFDMNYSDFLGAEMPGRWLAGGVKLKL